jgi:RimJ/RimL family protein N-acetyltransferase
VLTRLPSSPPPLAAAGVVLRPWVAADAPAFQVAARESVSTVGRWMAWCHAGYSVQEAETWIAHCERQWRVGDDREFGIFDATSNEVLGGAGLNQFNRLNNFGNLGYWVRAGRERRGVATAAATLLARYAFAELALTRVEVVIRLDNAASRRVAEKLGCALEGVARNRLLFSGAPHDAALYSLIPRDFPPAALQSFADTLVP